MYGLVNRGISQLIRSQFGDDTWENILDRAGIDDDAFIAMDSYDDQITYDLVVAASDELKTPVPELLFAFGEYWILYTADEGYGSLLNLYDGDLVQFLGSLNGMHEQVKVNFPELVPPRFEVAVDDAGVIELSYFSTRAGLAPMVLGLLTGLGKKFQQELSVEQTGFAAEGSPDVFRIVLQPETNPQS